MGGGPPLRGGPSKLFVLSLGLVSSALAAPKAGTVAPVAYSYTAGVLPGATSQPYAVPADNAAAVPTCRDAAECLAYCPATRIVDLPAADQTMKNVQLQVIIDWGFITLDRKWCIGCLGLRLRREIS
jgi:hypothetical protein